MNEALRHLLACKSFCLTSTSRLLRRILMPLRLLSCSAILLLKIICYHFFQSLLVTSNLYRAS
jgi:hypothetical protein